MKFSGRTLGGVRVPIAPRLQSSQGLPGGHEGLRTRLINLHANAELVHRARLAVADASIAVMAAERSHHDHAVAAHLVYMADRKLSIAEAQAIGPRSLAPRQGRAKKPGSDDKLQQRVALGTWEDEGGSAAAAASARPADANRWMT